MSTPRQQYIAVNWHRCKYEANSCLLLTLAADHVLRKVADTSDRAVPHAKEGVIRACRYSSGNFVKHRAGTTGCTRQDGPPSRAAWRCARWISSQAIGNDWLRDRKGRCWSTGKRTVVVVGWEAEEPIRWINALRHVTESERMQRIIYEVVLGKKIDGMLAAVHGVITKVYSPSPGGNTSERHTVGDRVAFNVVAILCASIPICPTLSAGCVHAVGRTACVPISALIKVGRSRVRFCRCRCRGVCSIRCRDLVPARN